MIANVTKKYHLQTAARSDIRSDAGGGFVKIIGKKDELVKYSFYFCSI